MVSSYTDDLIVSEDIVPVQRVAAHLRTWGLITKELVWLGEAYVCVLGLRVNTQLQWNHDKPLFSAIGEQPLSRRRVHSILGEWLGHFPIAGWLRVACGFLQCYTAMDGVPWDASVSDMTMQQL